MPIEVVAIRPDTSALAVGAAIGAVLAASNVYTGLTTAYVDGGAITAVILGCAWLRTRSADGSLAARLDVVQATASSAAVMVGVIGLAGPWPALHSLGHVAPVWVMMTWGLALGLLGLVLAHALRSRLIERDALPFPTGVATAEVVHALVGRPGEGRRRLAALVVAAIVAGGCAYAQQGAAWLPSTIELSLAAIGIDAMFVVGLSPLVIATGTLLGLRTALAVAGSGALVWLVAVPHLHGEGWIASFEFPDAVAWLMWPAMGLLLGDGVSSLVMGKGTWRRSFADLVPLVRGLGRRSTSDHAGTRLRLALVAVASVAIVVVGRWALGVPYVLGAAALVLAVVLSVLIARAAGETDVAPVGSVGALGQMAVGAQGPVTSLVGGSIPCGLASQTAQGLWILTTTHRLGLPARRIVLAQIVGIVVGTLVAVPVYRLLVSTHGIGTEAMPAWAAVSWVATAQAVQSGAAPPAAMIAAVLALVAGLSIARRRARRPHSLLPSPTALAIGALTPLSFSTAVLLGAVALFAAAKLAPAATERDGSTIAAGMISGEALVGIVLALVLAL